LALLPNREAVLLVRPVAVKSPASPTPQAVVAPLRSYEGHD
jgi:hypothetical protein